jgi:hypothetical protein
MFDEIHSELHRLCASDVLVQADERYDRYVQVSVKRKWCLVARSGFLHLLKRLPNCAGTAAILHELRASASRNEGWADGKCARKRARPSFIDERTRGFYRRRADSAGSLEVEISSALAASNISLALVVSAESSEWTAMSTDPPLTFSS